MTGIANAVLELTITEAISNLNKNLTELEVTTGSIEDRLFGPVPRPAMVDKVAEKFPSTPISSLVDAGSKVIRLIEKQQRILNHL